jgi:hypothetical protein
MIYCPKDGRVDHLGDFLIPEIPEIPEYIGLTPQSANPRTIPNGKYRGIFGIHNRKTMQRFLTALTDINWWLLGAEDQRRLSMPLALSLPQFLDTVPQARSLSDTILQVRSKYHNQGMEMSLILRSNIRIDIQEKGEYLP